ncbi:hypothetical protein [Aminobacter sp. MDW-2]|nr:hypothetical protein [Aminobacter sp. MDW-2]MRX33600.1 hypothetical protein [Aminobacter sp. MDW-2]QNH33354.1 hypothetical protein H5P29_23025 [Aminobacter sp. MDW-2]
MATTKAGGKDSLSKKGTEASKHLQTATPKKETGEKKVDEGKRAKPSK